jgi:hypothetical protein
MGSDFLENIPYRLDFQLVHITGNYLTGSNITYAQDFEASSREGPAVSPGWQDGSAEPGPYCSCSIIPNPHFHQ